MMTTITTWSSQKTARKISSHVAITCQSSITHTTLSSTCSSSSPTFDPLPLSHAFSPLLLQEAGWRAWEVESRRQRRSVACAAITACCRSCFSARSASLDLSTGKPSHPSALALFMFACCSLGYIGTISTAEEPITTPHSCRLSSPIG